MYNLHLKFLGADRSHLSPLPSHLQMQHLRKALFDILPPLKKIFHFCPKTKTNLFFRLLRYCPRCLIKLSQLSQVSQPSQVSQLIPPIPISSPSKIEGDKGGV